MFFKNISLVIIITYRYGHVPGLPGAPSSPAPSSPLLSPLAAAAARSHAWPIPVWQCFMAGSQVRQSCVYVFPKKAKIS